MRSQNKRSTTYSKLSTIRYDKNWQSRYFDLKYRSDSKQYFIAMPSLWLHMFKVQYYAGVLIVVDFKRSWNSKIRQISLKSPRLNREEATSASK